jgi:Tol biopolymer transport system component
MCNDGTSNIIAMLPDGAGRKWPYRESGTIKPRQGSIGSDGKTLLFSTENGKGVYTYDLASKTLTNLTGYGDFRAPAFSPDMSKVYVFKDENDEFLSINRITKVATVIDATNRLTYPSFTADGKIVCQKDGSWSSIAILNADGTGLVTLKQQQGSFWYVTPFAIPARNKIVYVENDYVSGVKDDIRICLMNTDGTGDAVLLGPAPYADRLASPTVNAAGTRLAYSQNVGTNNPSSGGNIIVCDFNGAALSNAKTIFTYAAGGIRIWRPMFCRIDKAVYEALADLN